MTATETPKWVIAWRKGFAWQFTVEQLRELAEALATDSPRLTQGTTVNWDDNEQDYAYCPVAHCLTFPSPDGRAPSLATTHADFAKAFDVASDRLERECTLPNSFTVWWDQTDRATDRAELLREVQEEINRRNAA